jgi:hypothetical protein
MTGAREGEREREKSLLGCTNLTGYGEEGCDRAPTPTPTPLPSRRKAPAIGDPLEQVPAFAFPSSIAPSFPKEPAKGFCSRRKGSDLHIHSPPPRVGAFSSSPSNHSDAICISLHVFSCPRGISDFFSPSKSVVFFGFGFGCSFGRFV